MAQRKRVVHPAAGGAKAPLDASDAKVCAVLVSAKAL